MITTNETDIPIAIWKGDNNEKKIIYLDTNPKINKENIDKEISEKDIDDSIIMYKMNKKNIEEKYKKIIDVIEKEHNENKKLEAYNGKFEFIPSFLSERIYLCGPPKSGKSYQIARYIEKYKKYFPENEVYLISDETDDENFKDLGLTQISIDHIYESFKKLKKNEERIEDAIKFEDFKDSLVIFDDIDSIIDKDKLKTVLALNDQIFKKGRNSNIYIIRSNHSCTEGLTTKYSLENSDIIFVFPTSGNHNGIENVLRIYYSVKYDSRKEIIDMKTRWVAIRKSAPLTLISENLIKIL